QADVERMAALVEAEDQGQGDGRLARRHGQDEQDERLSLEVAAVAGERRQVQRHPLQHHLGAEEHDDQVAPRQEADRPQAEQDGPDDEVVVQRDGVHALLLGTEPLVEAAVPLCSMSLRWAMAMAPMVATSSSVPASSTG